MKRVVERCPNCGVEHDDAKGGACEVCGTPLRFWCRVHSREIGWLNSATCPRCAAEAARPAPPSRAPAAPPREPAPPRSAPAPPRPRRPAHPEPPMPSREEPASPVWPEAPTSPPRRDPGAVLREGVEDLAPYAEAGANVAGRMVRAFFAVIRWVIGWGLLGALVGFLFPDLLVMGGATAEPVWTAMAGAMVGGGLGLFLGTIRAIRILFAAPRRPDS